MQSAQQRYQNQLRKIVKDTNTSKQAKIAQLRSFKAFLILELERKNKGIEYPNIKYKDLKHTLEDQVRKATNQIYPLCSEIYYRQRRTLALYSKAQKQQEKIHHLASFQTENNKLRAMLAQLLNIREEGEKYYRSLDHYLKCKLTSLGIKLGQKAQKLHDWKKQNINDLNGNN